ncbi:MAG: hypothetical protein NW220_00600 [Leptolyngbyaceae cyanobacterium bins.349]|nr:hypothetical protein [Leptolyngbyaceae cyanobacterium bins.349]
MKGRFLLGFLGILLLVVGCSGDRSATTTQPLPTQPLPTQPTETATSEQPFSKPLVTPARKVGTVPPVPGLLQSTNAKTRTNAIVTGRRDPFAAIPLSGPLPMIVSSSQAAPTVKVAPLPTGTMTTSGRLPQMPLPPVATAPIAPLPNLSGSPLPPLGVPVAPVAPPSPTALAESVQVTGVVQVAGKWNVIVKESTASSSRYVAVGEYLENGRVLVKRIVASQHADPVVVLQQDGVEIRKSLV